MKRLSPLALMQGRKTRKYDDGGYVDPVIIDAMEQDLEDFGATNIDDIWGDDASAGEVIDLTETPGYQKYLASEQDFFNPQAETRRMSPEDFGLVLGEQLGVSPFGMDFGLYNTLAGPQSGGLLGLPLAAIQGAPSAEPSSGNGEGDSENKNPFSTLFSKAGDWLGAKNWDGSTSEKTNPLGIDVSKLSDRDKILFAKMFGQKEEPSNWQKLLQLGLVGMGGLSSFADAKQKNKALKQYYNQVEADRERQLAEYEAGKARAARHSLRYADLNIAGRKFNRPV